MNCGLTSNPPTRRRRGFSFLEVLIALAVASAFLSGVYAVFIQIVKSQNATEARIEATRNGRTALASMSDELKAMSRLGGNYLLVGQKNAQTHGDGIDNDADGRVDEEKINGLDDDGDAGAAGQTDLHAQLGSLRERPLAVGKADLGDGGVDEDCLFGNDQITFRIYPRVPTPGITYKAVTYRIATYDGQPNVLVRQTEIVQTGATTVVTQAPLAFGVMGLDLLYWNPNATPQDQGWVDVWDTGQAATFPAPHLPLPASVYVRLTLYADPRPITTYQPGKPVETVNLETVVNVEQIIGSDDYERPTL